MAKRVEFISYDGKYPNLCRGTLVLKINNKTVKFDNCLRSGGRVWFDDDWDEHVETGRWSVYSDEIPEEYKHLIEEITDVVNDNVECGCCGGCV